MFAARKLELITAECRRSKGCDKSKEMRLKTQYSTHSTKIRPHQHLQPHVPHFYVYTSTCTTVACLALKVSLYHRIIHNRLPMFLSPVQKSTATDDCCLRLSIDKCTLLAYSITSTYCMYPLNSSLTTMFLHFLPRGETALFGSIAYRRLLFTFI